MAEDVDHESKTEAPTERRVREAVDKGQFALVFQPQVAPEPAYINGLRHLAI